MSKDLHDIDELFRSALEGHEETPSAAVKGSIDAALDKKDAESYKRRFIGWKRTALLLLLLLAGFALYELVIMNQGTDHSGQAVADQKPNAAPGEKQKDATLKNTNADNTIDIAKSNEPDQSDRKTIYGKVGNPENAGSLNHNIQDNPGQRNISAPGTIEISTKNGSKKRYPGNKIAEQNKEAVNDQQEFLTGNTKGNQPITGKQINWLDRNDDPLPKEKINPVELPERTPGQAQFSVVNAPALKISQPENTKGKKVKSFHPFWMVSSFVSYDRAGYKLDSDEPMAITSLKHREAHEPSFSVSLLLTRQLTGRWGLQSGIIYSNVAIGMKPQKTYAFRDPTGDIAYKYITSSGYAFFKPGYGPQPAVGDSLTTAEGKHTLEYISVPLMAKYVLLGKKVSLTPGAGIEANFITKANLEVDIEDGFNREIVIVKKLQGTKPFYLSLVADAEIKYNINKKLSLNFRPVYRHAISPITKNSIVETFPHSFGLGVGITIKF